MGTRARLIISGTPPAVSDSSMSVAENSSLMFTSADFTDNFTDAEPNASLEDVQDWKRG
jgi:hypothetical protein